MHQVAEILKDLQKARRADSRTQKELASDCGCSQSEISRILGGKVKNMHGLALILCETLKVTVPKEADFDFNSHLARIESTADSRQKELIHLIRHAYARLEMH